MNNKLIKEEMESKISDAISYQGMLHQDSLVKFLSSMEKEINRIDFNESKLFDNVIAMEKRIKSLESLEEVKWGKAIKDLTPDNK